MDDDRGGGEGIELEPLGWKLHPGNGTERSDTSSSSSSIYLSGGVTSPVASATSVGDDFPDYSSSHGLISTSATRGGGPVATGATVAGVHTASEAETEDEPLLMSVTPPATGSGGAQLSPSSSRNSFHLANL